MAPHVRPRALQQGLGLADLTAAPERPSDPPYLSALSRGALRAVSLFHLVHPFRGVALVALLVPHARAAHLLVVEPAARAPREASAAAASSAWDRIVDAAQAAALEDGDEGEGADADMPQGAAELALEIGKVWTREQCMARRAACTSWS